LTWYDKEKSQREFFCSTTKEWWFNVEPEVPAPVLKDTVEDVIFTRKELKPEVPLTPENDVEHSIWDWNDSGSNWSFGFNGPFIFE
jgi:hypothetical protein